MNLIALVLLAAIAAPTKWVSPPKIVQASQSRRACSDDPLDPCLVEELRIENLSFKALDVTLTCSIDDEQTITIPPRTRIGLIVELTAPTTSKPACKISRWKVHASR